MIDARSGPGPAARHSSHWRRSFCLALALGVSGATGALAQAGPRSVVDVVGEATETDVRLRWTLPGGVLPDSAFIVERTGGAAGAARFVVPAPLPASGVVARGLIEADAYDELIATFTPDPSLAADARQEREVERAMLTLTTVARGGWAEVLGMVLRDTTAVTGTTYTYRVTTSVGGSSVTVGEIEVTAGDVTPLPAPGSLEAQVDDEGVGLRWDLPDDGYLAAWRVRRADPDGTIRDLTEGGLFVSQRRDPDTGETVLPDVFLRDTTVAPNTTYAYVVVGLNLFGRETPPSDTLRVFFPDPVPLEVPIVTAVDVRDREIELFWPPPTDQRVAGIGVLRADDPALEGTLLTPDYLAPGTANWTDTTVTGGVSYYYSLVTVDAGGRRTGPGPPWAARAINLAPPSAPVNLRATPTGGSLELAWAPPPETDIRGYQLLLIRPVRPGDSARHVLVTPDLVEDTTWSFVIPPGTLDSLTLAVRASNTSFAKGPLSEPVTAAILDTVPPAAPLLERIQTGEGTVTLSWVPTTDRDVRGYRVRRSVQGDVPAGQPAPAPGDFPLTREDIDAEVSVFVDSAATPGLLHVYVVEAVDASGNVSAPSGPLAATPYRLAGPSAPRSLTARLADDGVALAWEPPTGDGIMFYVIERESPGRGGRFVQVDDPQLADATQALDPGGRPGHVYRVRAIDTAGNVGPPSEPAAITQ